MDKPRRRRGRPEKPIVVDAEPAMNLLAGVDDLLAAAVRIARSRREVVASIAVRERRGAA